MVLADGPALLAAAVLRARMSRRACIVPALLLLRSALVAPPAVRGVPDAAPTMRARMERCSVGMALPVLGSSPRALRLCIVPDRNSRARLGSAFTAARMAGVRLRNTRRAPRPMPALLMTRLPDPFAPRLASGLAAAMVNAPSWW